MTSVEFNKLINNSVLYYKELDRWEEFGIDLNELPIAEYGWNFLFITLPLLFNEEGVDWINWWIFERPSFYGVSSKAYTAEGKEIPMETIDDLWETVKTLQK